MNALMLPMWRHQQKMSERVQLVNKLG